MRDTSTITNDPALMLLLTKIHEERGLDFTQYKERMLLRRVSSRMSKYNARSYEDYLGVIEKEPKELDELVNALSINVTEFFRNPESFNAIKDIVIPRVIVSKKEHHHKIIRAWSCGCSIGDEPYSLAMLFLEKLGKARDKFLITVIGSDIDDNALKNAKKIVYKKERIKAIDNDIVEKYFKDLHDGTFEIKGSVSSMVRFRKHDIIKDTPYMHCDIILCRNILIYFNRQLQEEIQLKLFDCLNPGGFLVLGMTESLMGSAAKYFETVDNKLRIYRRPELKVAGVDTTSEVLSQGQIDGIVRQILEE